MEISMAKYEEIMDATITYVQLVMTELNIACNEAEIKGHARDIWLDIADDFNLEVIQ
jgi:hypothetical protein